MTEPPEDATATQQKPPAGARTALAAASYTVVAAAQKASGFILLILFTHVLTPSEYGQVALLTTVGALLAMLLTLGLEPRITYAYFRAGDDLPAYLRTARRVSVRVPIVVAAIAVVSIGLTSAELKQAWIMECVGACLLAAGTTYAYSVLRAARRVKPYVTLALAVLVTQVVMRVLLVAVLGWGPSGWAASDLAGGLVAMVVGYLAARSTVAAQATKSRYTSWRVAREGLPLIPHYLAQWGLSLSDRLILAMFVTTAALGIYSALYQIAAVTSLVLNEVNRAFMPTYAKNSPGSAPLSPLVKDHLRVAFILHSVFLLLGFTAIEIVLPSAYRAHDELYPMLALGALAYGLYFIPMNGLTLVAGITSQAPVISLTAFAVNLALNLALNSIWGLWGAVVATTLGYTALAAIAVWFESRSHAIPWRSVFRREAANNVVYASVVVVTIASTWAGVVRACSLAALVFLIAAMLLPMLKKRGWRRALSVGA